MASRLLQRGLTAGGAATTVTVCSWMGEQSTSKVTSRIASRSLQGLVGEPRHLFLRQQHKVFSSKTTEAAAPSKVAAAPSKAPTPESSKSFVQWYEGCLDQSPVITKMVTGSILWGIGDGVAQLIPQVAFDDSDSKSEKRDFTYDLPRTGRAVFFGFALHAPTSHVHFNFLEWITVRANVTGLGIPVFKTIMEQVCNKIESFSKIFFRIASHFSTASANKSLYTGVGFRIQCTMVPWVQCKE